MLAVVKTRFRVIRRYLQNDILHSLNLDCLYYIIFYSDFFLPVDGCVVFIFIVRLYKTFISSFSNFVNLQYVAIVNSRNKLTCLVLTAAFIVTLSILSSSGVLLHIYFSTGNGRLPRSCSSDICKRV